jgi:hypothetical protein
MAEQVRPDLASLKVRQKNAINPAG